MFRIGCVVFLSLLLSSNAFGQWIFHTQKSAFDDPSHFVLIENYGGQYAPTLSCKNFTQLFEYHVTEADDLDLDSLAYTLNIKRPELRIRIDSGDILSRAMGFRLAGPNGQMKGVTIIDPELLETLKSATNSIDIAVKVEGHHYYETSFSAEGIAESIAEFKERCSPR